MLSRAVGLVAITLAVLFTTTSILAAGDGAAPRTSPSSGTEILPPSVRADRDRAPDGIRIPTAGGPLPPGALARGSLPRRSPRTQVSPATTTSRNGSSGMLGLQAAGIDQSTPAGELGEMLDLVGGLGASSIRIDIPWQSVEGWRAGHWDFRGFDRLVDEARARDITVDFILDYNNPLYGGSWNEIPTNHAAWDRYVATVVSRYAGRVRSYEVWNEADNPDFNRDYLDPEAYLDLLMRTYPIVKAHDPQALVLMTSLSRAERTNPSFWALIAQRADAYFDICNIHVYSSQAVHDQVGYVQRFHRDKAVWATEVGAPAEDEAAQVAFLSTVIPELQAAGVEFIHVFSWRDNVTSLTTLPFGLLRSDNSERPAASTFRLLAFKQLPSRPMRDREAMIPGHAL